MNEPSIGSRERELVAACLESGWLTSGTHVEQLEGGWSTYCGRSEGVALSNGTAALQVAFRLLDLEPGDEVVMPTFTIMSCALAVVYNGGVPVLVDSDPGTFCMDVNEVEAKITDRTRAILAVDMYGHPADMDRLMAIAARNGIEIIEDAAEAHGAEHLTGRKDGPGSWRKCGSFGRMSVFSFYANKLITTGEGGMIVTDDAGVAQRARTLRNLAFSRERRFLHDELGFNFRLTDVQAAIGVAQIDRIDEIVARKRAIAARYSEALTGILGLQLPVERPWARSVFWMYAVVVNPETELTASDVARSLEAAGIETRPFFLGMHAQPPLRERGLFDGERYPVADRLARDGFYLPSGLTLSDNQVDQVSEAVAGVFE